MDNNQANNQNNLNNNYNNMNPNPNTNQVPNPQPTVEALNIDNVENTTNNVQPQVSSNPNMNNVNALNSMNLNNMTSMNPTPNPNVNANPNVSTNTNPTPNPNPMPNPGVVNPTTQMNNNVNPIPSISPIEPMPNTNPNDNFNSVPVPPVFTDPTPEKKNDKNKIVTIVLLVLVVLAVGFGLYYFLVIAKNNKKPVVSVIPKEVHLDLKDEIPTSADVYADISGIDVASCTVDTSKINNQTVNTYSYTINCNGTTADGVAIVEDTTKPEVVLNDLEVLVGNTPNAKDFIEYCIDASSCTYKLNSDLTTMINTPGNYEVEITVTDAYTNSTDVVANLTVSPTVAASYFTCTSEEEALDEIFATTTSTYKIGISADDTFYNATKVTKIVFDEKNDYLTQVEGYNPTIGINGIIGTASFDKINKTIIVKDDKSFQELLEELNASNLADNSGVIRAFFMMQGYTCE